MWEGNCSPERLKTKANDEKENIYPNYCMICVSIKVGFKISLLRIFQRIMQTPMLKNDKKS